MSSPPSSSRSEVILTSSPELPIAAHDPLSGATLAHFSGCHPPRKGLALAGNNLIAASHISADASGFIKLYNWWSSTAAHCIQVPEPVAPLVATLEGSYLFSGGLSGYVHALALPSGDLRRSFRAHRQSVSCLAVNDDGSLLISGGDDGTIAVFPIIRILDAASGDDDPDELLPLYQSPAHDSSVTGIACSSGGCSAIISSSSLDGTCKLWSMADGSYLRTVQLPCSIWSQVMDPTSSSMYAGGSDGNIYVVPLKAKGLMRSKQLDEPQIKAWEVAGQGGAVIAMALAEGNQKLVSASEDGMIRIWEVASGSIVQAFAHGGSISDLVVARVIDGSGKAARILDEAHDPFNGGLCEREMMKRKIGELMEMEQQLDVVVKDRRRTIDMFESLIWSYKKLLGLFLRNAKGENGKK